MIGYHTLHITCALQLLVLVSIWTHNQIRVDAISEQGHPRWLDLRHGTQGSSSHGSSSDLSRINMLPLSSLPILKLSSTYLMDPESRNFLHLLSLVWWLKEWNLTVKLVLRMGRKDTWCQANLRDWRYPAGYRSFVGINSSTFVYVFPRHLRKKYQQKDAQEKKNYIDYE